MNRRRAFALLVALVRMPVAERMKAIAGLPPPALRAVAEEWWWQAFRPQQEPEGDWLIWLLRGGRGSGKTRAGAEWVWERVREGPPAGRSPLQIALVGANLDEVVKVMVKGPSGLIATARTGEVPRWLPSARTLRFGCGALAFAYSAERPDSLRGPEHDHAWCDELAKWRHGDSTWDNLMLGLRRGERPRALVTTTPRAVPLIRRLRAMERFEERVAPTIGNYSLTRQFVGVMSGLYGGTRLGRQELDGELIEDFEGALWTRATIEACRVEKGDCPSFSRVVVGVDPPASAGGTCGISVCAIDGKDNLYVLADASESGLSPEGWAGRAARAAEDWGADRVVAEANNGGDMVASVFKGSAPFLPVRLVHASRGKVPRAEPVAAAFERGEAKFAGRFPALEDELAGLTTGGVYQGPGGSPDRADAMVWAMTELMARRRTGPRILQL